MTGCRLKSWKRSPPLDGNQAVIHASEEAARVELGKTASVPDARQLAAPCHGVDEMKAAFPSLGGHVRGFCLECCCAGAS